MSEAKADAMTVEELAALVAAELADVKGNESILIDQRAKAMNYYQGNMDDDMPSFPGRSKVVSCDVRDTVEGLMPALMEIFFSTDRVVEFDPVGQEDEEAADQESDYVNHVFSQKNDGFLVGHNFIKDALLQKQGIVKVFWEESEKEERETYYGITDDQLAMIASDPDVEIVEHTPHAPEDDAQHLPPQMPMGMPPGMPPMMPPGAPPPPAQGPY